MFFSLQVSNITFDRWRLQEDGSFRKLEDDAVQPGDRRFMMAGDMMRYYRPNIEVVLDGQVITANRRQWSPGEECFSFEGIAHREEQARTPAEIELYHLLAGADDSHPNTLVLTLDGHFELQNPLEEDVVYNPRIAARSEGFDAGNGYVGPKAAADREYVHRTYVDMLAGWVEHVETGALNVYDDMGTDESEASLLLRLQKWNAQWAS